MPSAPSLQVKVTQAFHGSEALTSAFLVHVHLRAHMSTYTHVPSPGSLAPDVLGAVSTPGALHPAGNPGATLQSADRSQAR